MDKKILKLYAKWRDSNTGLSFDEYCYRQGKAEGKANLDHAVDSARIAGEVHTINKVFKQYTNLSAYEFGVWLKREFSSID